MSGNVFVSLLETTVLSNVMQVVSSYDDCSLHFGGDDLSLEDSSTDRNITSEWTFLVNVWVFNSSIGSLNSKSYVLDERIGFDGKNLQHASVRRR